MKLVDFMPLAEPDRDPYPRFGLLVDDTVVEIGESERGTLTGWLERGMPGLDDLHALDAAVKAGNLPVLRGHERRTFPLGDVKLLAPVRRPPTVRDFYAFEQHVKAGNRIRGRDIPDAWYQIPVFYFSNPGSIIGPDDPVRIPKSSQALDFELEVACVIGRAGKDIAAEDAEQYIAGYTIFNDWSARDVQRQEVGVGLGPAKGKDFAGSLGPWLVTPDELADRATGRPGVYNLTMTARVNGVERSRGNWADLHYSFGEMVARASADAMLYPGDVIGSGTVGTGCLLELTMGQGPWLRPGDVVELEIERLGVLRTEVRSAE
ncbi:MAG: fumarylacetoacetate hydrolase family protein [Chloroflexi bacterium]|nr:fumarylacetoacetate hydrolase family protein [Chloroflexota bacterium]